MKSVQNVLSMAINSITNEAALVTDTCISVYDMSSQSLAWSFDYAQSFTEELYEIPWVTEHAVVKSIPGLKSWLVLFNQKFFKLFYNEDYISDFVDMDKSIIDFRYFEMSNLLIMQQANRKILTVAFLECENFFEQVAGF